MVDERMYMMIDLATIDSVDYQIVDIDEIKKEHNLTDDDEDELNEAIEEEVYQSTFDNYFELNNTKSNRDKLRKILTFLEENATEEN